jgi:D-3-phosphoglycerate dehydrogenase / 2-oxoglutarate reductase
MRVVVMEDYQRAVERLAAAELLAGHDLVIHEKRPETVQERASQIGDAEALVLIRERTPVDKALLDLLPSLRLICQTGRGMPHIDVDECTRRGILVCTGGGSARAPAELTLALILAASRHIVADAVALRSGTWQTTIGRELHGKTVGIVGYGTIGALVGRYCDAIGMKILAWGRSASLERAAADGVEPEPDLDALLGRSDIVSVHLKLTPETRGILGEHQLGQMKQDALFVNTARAALVEPGALARGLAEGRPGAAAVDVFDEEPALSDPLLGNDSVLATPHLGYVTWETYELYFREAFAQVLAYAAGSPTGVANPEALADPGSGSGSAPGSG